ncbi:MAG: helix-turn-helix transcriptional regulator [Alphaproteobacteria bacterium]|nr:helix-turn-helix transcriptional regulator [Alphaproteobacteria bacterium]
MEMELGKRIGKRLRELREQRGWTQAEFAERNGKAIETISNIERGKTVPGLLTLERFARSLGVGLEDLFRVHEAGKGNTETRHAAIILAAAKRLPSSELELLAGIIGTLDKQRRKSKRGRAQAKD